MKHFKKFESGYIRKRNLLIGLAVVLAAGLITGGVLLIDRLTTDQDAQARMEKDILFKQMRLDAFPGELLAENFTGTPVGDALPSLKDYHGQMVVLNFWATWCQPCKAEMPQLEALYKEMKDEGLVVLAISVDDTPKKVEQYFEENKLSFPALTDDTRSIAYMYGASGIPLTYLIAPNGQVIARALGPREWNSPQFMDYARLVIQRGY